MLIKCSVCTKEFHKKPSRITRSNYCADVCKGKDYSIKYSGIKNPNYKGISASICPICGTSFLSYSKSKQYCSRPCKAKWQVGGSKDANHDEICNFLENLDFSIIDSHKERAGFPDLIVAKHGLAILVEIKNGKTRYGASGLSRLQKRFFESWRGMRCVVICKQDCMRLSEQVNAIARQLRLANIDLRVTGCDEAQYQPRLYV